MEGFVDNNYDMETDKSIIENDRKLEETDNDNKW